MNGNEIISECLPPTEDRFFEDYLVGTEYACGSFSINEDEIVAFANLYDPQPMHTDPSVKGGLMASGWHTACLTMRLIAENFLSRVAGLPSPGVEAIAWTAPIRPGDRIAVTATVENKRVSKTKPDRGILTTTFVARKPDGTEAMTFRASNFVLLRGHAL